MWDPNLTVAEFLHSQPCLQICSAVRAKGMWAGPQRVSAPHQEFRFSALKGLFSSVPKQIGTTADLETQPTPVLSQCHMGSGSTSKCPTGGDAGEEGDRGKGGIGEVGGLLSIRWTLEA